MVGLAGIRVVVGVGGGIAAYKAVELVRALQDEGAQVRVAMTEAAQRFVGPLTFEALTRAPVFCHPLSLGADKGIEHVEWSHWAQLLVVAPATADLLARMAAGMANDAVTTLFLGMQGAVVVAPAMEHHMWHHPLTQRNLRTLRETGVEVVPPESGALASGRTGDGRLASLKAMVAVCERAVGPGDLRGQRVLVTAGPTQEALDPVRFVSNRSTGKMGVALASEAQRRGASVTLLAGPLRAELPPLLRHIPVVTAAEMFKVLRQELGRTDILLMAAAVSDYRPAQVAPQKLKKGAGAEVLELAANPDLLMSTRNLRRRCFSVGFAAETEELERHAREKLTRKSLDMLVANNVAAADAGFAVDTNRVTLLFGDGSRDLPLMSKGEVARAILDEVVARLPRKRKIRESRRRAAARRPRG